MRIYPSRRLRRLIRETDLRELRRSSRKLNPYLDAYQIDLGFQSSPHGGPPISPGDIAAIRVPILKPFRVTELHIPSRICCDFELLRLVVCDVDFLSEDPISCAHFSEVSNTSLELPLIPRGGEILLIVRNIGPLPLRFLGVFRGERLSTPASGRDRKGRPHTWKRRLLVETKALVRRASLRARSTRVCGLMSNADSILGIYEFLSKCH
jgi:hypothetical protein